MVPLRKSISTQTPGRKKMLKSWFLRPSEIWFVGIPKSCATLAMSQSFILSWHQSHLNSALSLHASWFRGVDFFGEIHRKLHSFTPNVGVSGVSHSTYPYHIPLTMFFWEAWYGLAMVQLGAGVVIDWPWLCKPTAQVQDSRAYCWVHGYVKLYPHHNIITSPLHPYKMDGLK